MQHFCFLTAYFIAVAPALLNAARPVDNPLDKEKTEVIECFVSNYHHHPEPEKVETMLELFLSESVFQQWPFQNNPDTQELMARFDPGLPTDTEQKNSLLRGRWSFSPRWALAAGTCAFIGVIAITHRSEFLYWQF